MENLKYLNDMGLKASTIVASHLSDSQQELGMKNSDYQITARLNFAKFIIFKFSDNLDRYVDADLLWSDFKKAYSINTDKFI